MSLPADEPFLRAVEPYRTVLRLHCYRMLGSSSDGDDVMQEVLLRAWRAQATLSDPALLKPWLYRIATNACLDELARRPRRALASDLGHPADDPRAGIGPAIDEPVWLEPMPDTWLHGAPEPDPAARYTLKESVALAFVAALHALTAVQRATLLLRDVLGFSAEETAAALDLTVSAANSALFRARTAVETRLGDRPAPASPEVDEALLARYLRAWESADVPAMVALLRDDVITTMPPAPTWIAGHADNAVFYEHMFATRMRGVPYRVARTAANGQPAFAFYRATAPDPRHTLRAIQVLTLRGGGVARVDHFMTPAAFPAFGLPASLD